jgi:G:T/U-mismatch repair DNA glycosylase
MLKKYIKHVDDNDFAAFLKNAGIPEVMIPMLTATKAAVRMGYSGCQKWQLFY